MSDIRDHNRVSVCLLTRQPNRIPSRACRSQVGGVISAQDESVSLRVGQVELYRGRSVHVARAGGKNMRGRDQGISAYTAVKGRT